MPLAEIKKVIADSAVGDSELNRIFSKFKKKKSEPCAPQAVFVAARIEIGLGVLFIWRSITSLNAR